MSRLEQIQRKALFFLSTKTALQGYWELVGGSWSSPPSEQLPTNSAKAD